MSKKSVNQLLSRLHHVGVLVNDMDRAVEHYENLGFGRFLPSKLVHVDREMRGKPAPDVKNIGKGLRLGPIGFELVQPVAGQSIQKEYLETHGECINHIAFVVDDIQEAIAVMIQEGFKLMSYSKNEGGGGMAYFDTDKIGGVQIELEQLPPFLADDPFWGTT